MDKRNGSERACLEAVANIRWREGFECPRCGHDRAYGLGVRGDEFRIRIAS